MNIWGEVGIVDILAIGVHPDDVELSCSGTLLRHIEQGYSVGILDLTEGELGTRGDRNIRLQEAHDAAEMIGARFRVMLDLGDGFFQWTEKSIRKIIPVIRAAQPGIVLCNALSDRHPDHGRAAKLTADACFMSGLTKVTSSWNNKKQDRWRPELVLHYVQDYFRTPDIVVDISEFQERKMEVILQFKSQFYDPNSKELSSPISGKDFLDFVEARGRVMGRYIQKDFAEGFETSRALGVSDLTFLS